MVSPQHLWEHMRAWPKSAALWLLGGVVGLLVLLALSDGLPPASSLLAQLLYLPILLAAAGLGLRGGIVVGLLVALTARLWGPGEETLLPSSWIGSSLYLVFGLVVGTLFQVVHHRLERLEKRTNRLSAMYTQTLSSLAHTVEVRDRHTQGHSERVARNALVLGRELGFSARHLELLYWSAMLHDLGKIAVPDYVLLKDGPLSAEEYDEIKRHPEYAAELLASLSGDYTPIATVVRSHHERWDGLGYPQGLVGAEIPLMSRIISIVDVFEALTSQRPYRDPMAPERALEFVLEAAGRQFDPNLVDVFELCYRRGDILAATDPPLPLGEVVPARVPLTEALG